MGSVAGDELTQWEKMDSESIGGGGGGGGKEDRILVSVRMRPLNAMEIARNDSSDWECISSTTIIFNNSVPDRSMFPTAYSFDRVFGCDSTTKQVYEDAAKEVALSVVSGFNSSIFAYGQTSSGKTYTMSGITEYSVADIYDYIEKHAEREFRLKFAAMEIYNEAVRDLLSADSTPLRLLDDPERGTIVEKLTEEPLRDWGHFQELLSLCEAQRQIGETSLNEMSSRSHQILRLTIESSAREFLGKDKSNTLSATVNFVDLAGSERASQALSAGARLKEGCHINRSLLTLGTVIRKLSKGRNGHIPFRDSKLTRILQTSLGGNARTAIICTMSPARSHIEQSRNTLLFATCAKEVVTNAQVNVVMSDKALVKQLQRELARLNNELRCPGSASGSSQSDALKEKDSQIKKMEKEIKELMQQRDLAQSRLEDLLHVVGDDNPSRDSDEYSQYSTSHLPHGYDDTRSVSETSGIVYQRSLGYGLVRFESNSYNQKYLQLSDKLEEQHSLSPRNSVSSSQCDRLIQNQQPAEVTQRVSNYLEDHCKEVRCIEIDESKRNMSVEFNLLSTDESDFLVPLKPDITKQQDHGTRPMGDTEMKSAIKERLNIVGTNDHHLKPYPDESSPLSSVTVLPPTRTLPLNRSRSCRATLMASLSPPPYDLTSSPPPSCKKTEEMYNSTPPSDILRNFLDRPESFQWRQASHDYGSEVEKLSGEEHQVFQRRQTSLDYGIDVEKLSREESLSDDQSALHVVEAQDSVHDSGEEDATSISSSVAGLKEMAQIQFQKQLSDDQVEQVPNEEFGEKGAVKNVGVDPIQCSSESPSRWPLEFEKKQLEIINLWHECHVSLIHRSCFFQLFKGDQADDIYMEVEHRRLSFLRNTHSEKSNVLSSERNVRREREMLFKQMQKRLSAEERESIYTKWGITLDSKQRRLQLARRLWTETNLEHVQESASIVSKLTGVLESGHAFREMFGLSFASQQSTRRSHSWRHGRSSFK